MFRECDAWRRWHNENICNFALANVWMEECPQRSGVVGLEEYAQIFGISIPAF